MKKNKEIKIDKGLCNNCVFFKIHPQYAGVYSGTCSIGLRTVYCDDLRHMQPKWCPLKTHNYIVSLDSQPTEE